MAEFLTFETDFSVLAQKLRQASPKFYRKMSKNLRLLAAEVVDEARTKIPSGMEKGVEEGLTVGYRGTRGVWMQAGGRSKPASWIGAYEGGLGGRRGFRHPVYPASGEPRKSWHWAGAHGQEFQTPGAPLQKAWIKARPEVVPRMEAAILEACKDSGLLGE